MPPTSSHVEIEPSSPGKPQSPQTAEVTSLPAFRKLWLQRAQVRRSVIWQEEGTATSQASIHPSRDTDSAHQAYKGTHFSVVSGNENPTSQETSQHGQSQVTDFLLETVSGSSGYS